MAIDKIDSFDHGVLSAAGTGLYGSITGASPQIEIVTTRPRTGAYSLKIAPNGATIFASYNNAGANFGGTQRSLRVYVNVDVISTTGAFAISILNALGGRFRVLFDAFSPMQIAAACEGGTSVQAGTTYALDTWHIIDMAYNVAAATHTGDWKVNGVAQTQCTFASSATTINTAELRYEGTATDGQCFFDDLVMGTTVAEFPILCEKVVYHEPVGVGTHSVDAATSSFFFKDIGGSETALGNSGDTTSYQQIDDDPISADTDHVLVRPVTGAFPTIPTGGRILTSNQLNTTATRTFPNLSGLTKNSGDLLIAICVGYQSSAASGYFSGWSAGWTEFLDVGSSTGICIGAAYKFSDGTETGTISVTQVATITGNASMILLSIPGAHASTPPEGSPITNGTSSAADPASFDPAGWASEDTLWISLVASGEDSGTGSWTATGTTAPTNYGSRVDTNAVDNSVAGEVEAAVAFRQLIASSENVGTAGVDTSNARNSAVVIAVRPATASSFPSASHYLEYALEDNSEAWGFLAVRGIIRQRQDSASADTIAAKLRADGVEGNIYSGAINTATDEYKSAVFAQTPNSTAWDDTKFDAATLRWGYTADADTTPRLVAAGVEVAHSTTPVTVSGPVHIPPRRRQADRFLTRR